MSRRLFRLWLTIDNVWKKKEYHRAGETVHHRLKFEIGRRGRSHDSRKSVVKHVSAVKRRKQQTTHTIAGEHIMGYIFEIVGHIASEAATAMSWQ